MRRYKLVLAALLTGMMTYAYGACYWLTYPECWSPGCSSYGDPRNLNSQDCGFIPYSGTYLSSSYRSYTGTSQGGQGRENWVYSYEACTGTYRYFDGSGYLTVSCACGSLDSGIPDPTTSTCN